MVFIVFISTILPIRNVSLFLIKIALAAYELPMQLSCTRFLSSHILPCGIANELSAMELNSFSLTGINRMVCFLLWLQQQRENKMISIVRLRITITVKIINDRVIKLSKFLYVNTKQPWLEIDSLRFRAAQYRMVCQHSSGRFGSKASLLCT